MKNKQCNHITGQYWDINSVEGPAYIRKWMTVNSLKKWTPDASDVNFIFKYCPLCGEKNVIPKQFSEYILKVQK